MAEESNNDGGGGFADFLKWLPTLWAVNQAAGDPAGLSEPSLTEEQEQLFSKQSEMFDLIMEDMRRRNSLSLRQDPETGELSGPLVETLNTALGNVRQQQAAPRMRVQAQSFNPFGEARDPQMFGADIPVLAPPSDVVAGDGGTGDGDTGGDDDTAIVDDGVVEGPESGEDPFPPGQDPFGDDPIDVIEVINNDLPDDGDADDAPEIGGMGWNPPEITTPDIPRIPDLGIDDVPGMDFKIPGVPRIPDLGIDDVPGMDFKIPDITTPDLPRIPRIPDLGIPDDVNFPGMDFKIPDIRTGVSGLVSNGLGDVMDALGDAVSSAGTAAEDYLGNKLGDDVNDNVGQRTGYFGRTPDADPGDVVEVTNPDGSVGVVTVGEDPLEYEDPGLTPEQTTDLVTDRENSTDQFDRDRVPGAGLSIASAIDDVLFGGAGFDKLQDWGIIPGPEDRSVSADQAWAEYANKNGIDRNDTAARAEYDQRWADIALATQILGDPQNLVTLRTTIENAPNSAIGMIGNNMSLSHAAQFSEWYWTNFDAIQNSGFSDPVLAQIYSTEGIDGLMAAGLPGPDGVYASTEGGILSGGMARGSGDTNAPQRTVRTQADIDEEETSARGGYRK